MAPTFFKTIIVAALMTLLPFFGNAQAINKRNATAMDKETLCSPGCKAANKTTELSCKLAAPELRQRKETVLADLKRQVLEKKELKDGFAFRFPGTDAVLDQLTEFIKTERECCHFFIFTLSVSGDKSEAWLELTGPEGAKDFVTEELGL